MSDRLAKRLKMDEGNENEVQRKITSSRQICNLTSQKFSEIVGLAAFVDKTLFIKAFLQDDNDVIVALAPRKFGKSTNMDMVKEFVTGNKKLFEDNQLKIWESERDFFNKYCEKNPVIHVDFKNVYCTTKYLLLESLKEVTKHAFNDHKYLIKVDRENYSWSDRKLEDVGPIGEFEMYWKSPKNLSRFQVIKGLKDLCRCLNIYHDKRVYVFIDEYDAPIMDAIKDTSPGGGAMEETINLIGAVMSSLFKGNEYIKKGLIIGCTRIAEVLSGDANNIQYYEFLRIAEFSPYFGFTDKEVNSLSDRKEFVTLKNAEFKMWYGGYKLVHNADYVIYNSYSVLKYLWNSWQFGEPRFENYWVNSGSIDYLQDLFAECNIFQYVHTLINGDELPIDTIAKFSKEDVMILKSLIHQKLRVIGIPETHLFLQFLTENGYFNVVRTGNETTTIGAPNNEIKNLLKEKGYSLQAIQKKYNLCPENISNFQNSLTSLFQSVQ